MDRTRWTSMAAFAAFAIGGALVVALPARASAPPDQYVITNNGTPDDVTDDTVLDVKTKLRWQRVFSPPVTWDSNAGAGSAQAYCAALSVGAFASGWRMPGLKELITIVDVRSRPAFDAKVFPGIALGDETGQSKRFWSAMGVATGATINDGGPPTYVSAWAVGRGAGHAQPWKTVNNATPDHNVVRCVRSP